MNLILKLLKNGVNLPVNYLLLLTIYSKFQMLDYSYLLFTPKLFSSFYPYFARFTRVIYFYLLYMFLVRQAIVDFHFTIQAGKSVLTAALVAMPVIAAF